MDEENDDANQVFAGFKNTKGRGCVLGKHCGRKWLILKIIIMRKQLLIACLLCAQHNAGHSIAVPLTLTTQ